MAKKLINAKEFMAKRVTNPVEIENHLFKCAKKIVKKEVKRALNFEIEAKWSCDNTFDDDHTMKMWCYFLIEDESFKRILEDKYFPTKRFETWLKNYGWEYLIEDYGIEFSSVLFNPEELGVTLEELKNL